VLVVIPLGIFGRGGADRRFPDVPVTGGAADKVQFVDHAAHPDREAHPAVEAQRNADGRRCHSALLVVGHWHETGGRSRDTSERRRPGLHEDRL
jgi:hypothetical protein